MEDIRAQIRELIKAIKGEEKRYAFALLWYWPGQHGDDDASTAVLKALENIAGKPGGATLIADLHLASRIVEGFEVGTRSYLIQVRIGRILNQEQAFCFLGRKPTPSNEPCGLCGGPGVQTFRLMPRPYDQWAKSFPQPVCRVHADARVRKRHLDAIKRSLAPLLSLKTPWAACTSAPWFLPMEFFNLETEETEIWPQWLRKRFQRDLRAQKILDVWCFLTTPEIRQNAYSTVVAKVKTSRRRQRASRNNGKLGGRPPAYSSSQMKKARAPRAKGLSQATIAMRTGLSQATVSRLLKK